MSNYIIYYINIGTLLVFYKKKKITNLLILLTIPESLHINGTIIQNVLPNIGIITNFNYYFFFFKTMSFFKVQK